MDNEYCEEQINPAGSTPYDDVFRTLVTDCSSLVLPLLNEAFNENYTGNETIEFRPNEHFLRQQDGIEQKRITDSSFRVIGSGQKSKSYLLECQSVADSSMLVRIVEYVTQIALDESTVEGDKLILEIPNAAVLFLRSTKNTPDSMEIQLRTPGGNVTFPVPVVKAKSYDINRIFEKKLYFLIPFYLFRHESRFKKIDADPEELDNLRNEYRDICIRLTEAMQDGNLTAFTEKTIAEMSGKVLEALAAKYGNIRKGVKSVMGGVVLDYEAKRILYQGIEKGRAEGIEKGRAEGIEKGRVEGIEKGRVEGIEKGRAEGIEKGKLKILFDLVQDRLITVADAANKAGLSEVDFISKMNEVTASA